MGVPPCVTQIITENCVICHSGATAAILGADLNLEGDFVPRLVDKPATYKSVQDMAACVPGAKLIDSTTPANSVFLKKILATQNCGVPMPQGTPLADDKKQCLSNWVNTF